METAAATGGDPVPADPMDRVYFSARPWFKKGAEEAHPICSPKQSLLARVEVAEALEAVHIYTGGQDVADTGAPQLPLDEELAKKGLSWLRKHIDGDENRSLRKRVIDTKSYIDAEEQAEAARAAEAQAAEERERRREAEARAAEEARAATQAARIRERQRQEVYRAELDEVVVELKEAHPDLDFVPFLGLCDEIEIFEEKPAGPDDEVRRVNRLGSDKEFFTRRKRGFYPKIERRRAEYTDPDVLQNDITIRKLIHDRMFETFDTGDFTVLAPYGAQAFIPLHESMLRGFFHLKELSAEEIDKWLQAIAANPKPIAIAVETGQEGIGDQILDHGLASYGKNLFENTFRQLIDECPERLVDTVYMIAEQGLDPQNPAKCRTTVDILRQLFKSDVLAVSILYVATLSENLRLRRKALDFHQTMLLIDPEKSVHIFDRERIRDAADTLTDAQVKVISGVYERYLKLNGRALSPEETLELDRKHVEYASNFVSWAENSLEGLTATLYARFPGKVA